MEEFKDILGYSVEDILKEAIYSHDYEIVLKGELKKDIIIEISKAKKEPEWMLRHRLKALEWFHKLPFPKWLHQILEKNKVNIDLKEFDHYLKPKINKASSWEDLPKEVREYYEKLGLPEQEILYLSGLAAQFDSEIVYKRMKEILGKYNVTFEAMEDSLKYDLVRQHFGRIFPMTDHKFAALHHALWSGGVFVYVPENVKIPWSLEAFFLISREAETQTEHSLIIADKNSEISFVEGCAAPILRKFSFHDGMVELLAKNGSKIQFVTLQNWSKDIINFNNKRAHVMDNAAVKWVEISMGSKITVTYPSSVLIGDNSYSEALTVSISKGNIYKDTGNKMIHIGKNTKSKIVSKSISAERGINVYRGQVYISKGSKNSRNTTLCDSLILDKESKTITIPHDINLEPTAYISHEAFTLRLSEEMMFYLQSKGMDEIEAKNMIVMGYLRDVMKEIASCAFVPYVFKKVIELDFSKYGSVG